MTEIFDSKFHKQYVGGEGEIFENESFAVTPMKWEGMTREKVLSEYRWYVRDSQAELPEEVQEQLDLLGVI